MLVIAEEELNSGKPDGKGVTDHFNKGGNHLKGVPKSNFIAILTLNYFGFILPLFCKLMP